MREKITEYWKPVSAAIAAADSRGDGYVSVPKMKSIIDNCVLPVSEDHFKRSVSMKLGTCMYQALVWSVILNLLHKEKVRAIQVSLKTVWRLSYNYKKNMVRNDYEQIYIVNTCSLEVYLLMICS